MEKRARQVGGRIFAIEMRRLSHQLILYGAAALLVALAIASADLAAVAYNVVGGRDGGALTVIFLQLAVAYAAIAAALIARARGHLREQLTVERLHLLGTATGFTAALPLAIVIGVWNPLAIGLLAFLLGFLPSAFYALPEVRDRAATTDEGTA